MSLKLMFKDANKAHGYRPTWYAQYRNADGKTKVVNLGIKVEGNPPKSGYLGDRGDRAFEQSRKLAQAKHDQLVDEAKDKRLELANAKMDREEAKHHLRKLIAIENGGSSVGIGTDLTTLADEYLARHQVTTTSYRSQIREAFRDFAEFAAGWEPQPITTTLAVTDELASAYIKRVADMLSWETTKKRSYLLTSIFGDLLPPDVKNPFKGVRKRVVKNMEKIEEGERKGERKRVETTIHHQAIDPAQIRRVWTEAERMGDTMLHDLAVIAATTAFRIGDCCLLHWSDCHLNGPTPTIRLDTQKTGSNVAIPIFSYDPEAEDYDEYLGELKRVLERRLAERKDGDEYVIGEAAKLYLTTTKNERGEELTTGRGIIYQRGKALFARGLFGGEEAVEDMVATEDEPSPEEVAELISKADWTEERRERVKAIYTAYKGGKTYRQIQHELGYSRSTISYDLGSAEKLASVRIRPRTDRPSIHELVELTRKQRKVGKCSASLFGWHCLRTSWVVLAYLAGVPLEDIRAHVGHSTADTTIKNYLHLTQKQSTERVRRILSRRNLNTNAPTLLGDNTAKPMDLAALAASLSEEQRLALAAMLQI